MLWHPHVGPRRLPRLDLIFLLKVVFYSPSSAGSTLHFCIAHRADITLQLCMAYSTVRFSPGVPVLQTFPLIQSVPRCCFFLYRTPQVAFRPLLSLRKLSQQCNILCNHADSACSVTRIVNVSKVSSIVTVNTVTNSNVKSTVRTVCNIKMKSIVSTLSSYKMRSSVSTVRSTRMKRTVSSVSNTKV